MVAPVLGRAHHESGRERTRVSRHFRSGDVRDAAAHHSHCLEQLLGRRPELRGVSAMADLIRESVRWSA